MIEMLKILRLLVIFMLWLQFKSVFAISMDNVMVLRAV